MQDLESELVSTGGLTGSSADVDSTGLKMPQPASEQKQYFQFTTQVLHFVLSSNWEILTYNREAGEQFSFSESELEGKSLRALLEDLDGRWASLLPESLSDISVSEKIFLLWNVEESPGLGWDLQILDRDQTYYLSLVPMLAPEVSPAIGEDQLALDSGSLQKTLRHLFFRTQQQELRFRFFVRHLPGAHFAQNKELEFTLLNDALVKLLGEKVSGYVRDGKQWMDWIHPSDLDDVNRNLSLCREGCVPVASRFRVLIPEDDRILYLMELRMPVRGLDGKLSGYECLWLDLTRESIAERRLQQASWKESLSEISGSLSHNFNNVLGGLCGLSDLVFQATPPDSESYEHLKIISEKSREAVGLIQRIIALNREEWGQIELHNLVQIIQDQEELIRIVLPKDAKFSMELPSEEIPVRLDAVALRRVLINFTSNSRDAIGFKGQVDLIARVVSLEDYDRSHLFSSHCATRGRAVEILFRDDGCGIDPSIIHRIFGPYFSTKESSQDSGLGLYSLTQFARENKFDFGVRSQLGQGTEMILLLKIEEFEDEYLEELPDPSLDLDHALEMVQVGILGERNSFLEPIVEMLKHNHYSAEVFENESSLEAWLSANESKPVVLITSMSKSTPLARDMCSRLQFDRDHLLSLLLLKGLNPDHFSDFIGKTFDDCYLSSSDPAACFRRIIEFLDAKS